MTGPAGRQIDPLPRHKTTPDNKRTAGGVGA